MTRKRLEVLWLTPVEIETEAVYEVDTYGSSMAPFYTVLALWVGGLILVAIIHTKVEMEPSFKNAKPHQQIFWKIYHILSDRPGSGADHGIG